MESRILGGLVVALIGVDDICMLLETNQPLCPCLSLSRFGGCVFSTSARFDCLCRSKAVEPCLIAAEEEEEEDEDIDDTGDMSNGVFGLKRSLTIFSLA